MRELREIEIQQVGGGLAPWAGAAIGGFALGATTAGASAALSGASWRNTLSAALLGGLSGATGGVATVTVGAMRAVNTIRSVGYGIASSGIASSSSQGGHIEINEGQELDVSK